jgi:perosamine synthetase
VTEQSCVPATVVSFDAEERDAVMRVLDSGRIVQGPEVAAFEQAFAGHVAGRESIAVNSGTSALHLALLAAGIGPGDEVIVPSFSFAASANAIAMTGAVPIFVDIESGSFCLDPARVEVLVGPQTAAIMAVHLYGHPADTTALATITDRYGLLLVEDAAQAVGASADGTPVGALGDVAAFSFYATKNLSTGEGGMVVASDPQIARRVRLLRNQGMERVYHNEIAGLNNRMTEIAAALGQISLARLGQRNRVRREWAAAYDAGLREVVTVPPVRPGVEHAYHQYTIRTAARDEVVRRLDEQGVEARVFYPTPIHRLPAYALDADLPVTERATREVMSLPIRPDLTEDQVRYVVESVREIVRSVS